MEFASDTSLQSLRKVYQHLSVHRSVRYQISTIFRVYSLVLMPLSTLFVFINSHLVFKKGNNQYIVTVAMSEADITSRLAKDMLEKLTRCQPVKTMDPLLVAKAIMEPL